MAPLPRCHRHPPLSGLSFAERFANAGNTFRAAVIPLVGACLLLIGFLVWARWDFVFKDPARLPMSWPLRIAVWVYALAIIVQFAVVDWGKSPVEMVAAVMATGVLVGFAEEVLFRGVILRSLRTGRSEAMALLIVSVWFGLFHLMSILGGLDIISALVQVALTFAAGIVYYLFRRASGLLVWAMAAHGLWDASAFLPVGPWINANRVGLILIEITALVALVVMLVRDRRVAVTPTGLQDL